MPPPPSSGLRKKPRRNDLGRRPQQSRQSLSSASLLEAPLDPQGSLSSASARPLSSASQASLAKIACMVCSREFTTSGSRQTHENACLRKLRLEQARASWSQKIIASKKNARMRALVDFETPFPSIFGADALPQEFANAAGGSSPQQNHLPADLPSPGPEDDADLGVGDMSITEDYIHDAELEPSDEEVNQRMRSDSLASGSGSTSPPTHSFPFTTCGRPSDTTVPAFKTEYHPNSGRPTRFYSYEEYRRPVKQQVFDKDEHPWRPFLSRGDSELASIAVDAQLSDSMVKRLLSLIKDVTCGKAAITFDSVKNLRDACDTATKEVTPVSLQV